MPSSPNGSSIEWFADSDRNDGQVGLRFSCTQCGNCCSGPTGYVLLSDAEARALADHLKLDLADFLSRYTRMLPEGRSLIEKRHNDNYDCIFLDRDAISGKAACSVYHHRPAQCRTWPFWPSLLKNRSAWERGKRTCPGLDTGQLHTPVQIRIQRDAVRI